MDIDYSERVCTKCGLREPGDERHVVFRCPAVANYVRDQDLDKLCWNAQSSMPALIEQNKFALDLPMFISKLVRTYSQCQDVGVARV